MKPILSFLVELQSRNEYLYYYGLICLLFGVVCLILAQVTSTQVLGVNAWYKPFKFAFSTFVFSYAIAWYMHYIPDFNPRWINWTIISMLSLEILYIAIQAGRGEQSHFNVSTSLYSALWIMMAIAATIVTLVTAYVGVLFFVRDFPDLPPHYLWAIRMGIVIFVVFAFQGFAMGARMNHSVGALNDNSNWFIVGWSRTVGDLRVAHFIGMHALQVLPLLACYVFKSTKSVLIVSCLYGLLALITLIQALKGKPLWPG